MNTNDDLLRTILNSIKTTVYAKDVDGRFIFVNSEWEKATGLSSCEVIGKTDYELLGFELGEYYWNMDKAVIENRCPVEQEEIIEVEGKSKTILSIKVPLKEDNELLGLCGIGTDITKIKRLQENLEQERDKSKKLLLNVLPQSVADELMEKGTTTSECFESVGVLFSDIVDFTRISSDLNPEILISELNDIFTQFDEIIEVNECERIKTIGDAYMAVCGLPNAHPYYADKIVDSAVKLICALKQRALTNELSWNSTIGIHGGRVVGGVVGTKKYIYDVFGTTVNMASRLQAATKIYDAEILISDSIYDRMENRENHNIRELDIVRVKGEDQPLKIYEIYDCDSNQMKSLKQETLERFNMARQHYINGEFKQAMSLFKECKEINADDKILSVYIKRCNTMMRLPPTDNWHGISGI